uniref:Integrase catalytic domain-containing protein n=1 Tax=Knipowitschia caucasica TaxID=637954 RepID=A0AAV2MJB3_KNICA
MFGVSKRTIRRRMRQSGLRKRDLYSAVNDEELDRIVSEVHRRHPNDGYKLMRGHLNARGVRVPISRLQESLRRVDAEGVHLRRLRLRVLRRRQYSVPGPNSLWHIDGHHKLIRWRFVVHGGVDGFSRLVVYLTVAGNNRACTVLQSFFAAVEQYGLPSRVRSDKGGENADVAEFMIRSRGTDRNSHITGRSVHNQRIERMWRDVYEHALDLFYQIFTSLEYQGTLNPDNEVYEGYGIDWNGPHALHGGTVSVPEIELARELSDEEVAILPAPGVSITEALRSYVETVQVLERVLD